MTELNKKLQQLIDDAYEAFWRDDDEEFNRLNDQIYPTAMEAQKEGGYFVSIYERNNQGSWTQGYFTGLRCGPSNYPFKVFFESEEEAREAINRKNEKYAVLVDSADMQIKIERA